MGTTGCSKMCLKQVSQQSIITMFFISNFPNFEKATGINFLIYYVCCKNRYSYIISILDNNNLFEIKIFQKYMYLAVFMLTVFKY